MAEQATDPGRPYGGESRADRESARLEKLIAAGVKTFGTVGYRAATVGGICEEAALNKRYFYASFATLEDLLCAVYHRIIVDLRAGVFAAGGEDPLTVLRGFVDGFLGWVQAEPIASRVHLFEVLGVSARVDDLYRSYARSMGDEMCDRLTATLPGFDVTPGQRRLIGDLLVGAGLQMAVDWVIGDFQPPREELLGELDGVVAWLLPAP